MTAFVIAVAILFVPLFVLLGEFLGDARANERDWRRVRPPTLVVAGCVAGFGR